MTRTRASRWGRALMAVGAVTLVVGAWTGQAQAVVPYGTSAQGIVPTFIAGNTGVNDCPAGTIGHKVDPPAGWGTGNIVVTVSADEKSLAWSDGNTGPYDVVAVLVKGGPDSHLYTYSPTPSFPADSGLVSPLVGSGGGNTPKISHYTICYVGYTPPATTTTALAPTTTVAPPTTVAPTTTTEPPATTTTVETTTTTEPPATTTTVETTTTTEPPTTTTTVEPTTTTVAPTTTTEPPATTTTVETTTTTEAPRTLQVSLRGYCENDTPYLAYSAVVNFDPGSAPITIRWGNGSPSPASVTYEQVISDSGSPSSSKNPKLAPWVGSDGTWTSSGVILYPGTELDSEGRAVDWPGWHQLPDGTWVFNAGGQVGPDDVHAGGNLRGADVFAYIQVNPEVLYQPGEALYPPATPDCNANPPSATPTTTTTTGTVEGVALASPTTVLRIPQAAELPKTGSSGVTALLLVGTGLLLGGGILTFGARRRVTDHR